MATLEEAIKQGLAYRGHWALDTETGQEIIIVSAETVETDDMGIVLQPGSTNFNRVPARNLKIIDRIAWGDQLVPPTIEDYQDPLDLPGTIHLTEIPKSIRREIAEELKGCWVESCDEFFPIVGYEKSYHSDDVLHVVDLFFDTLAILPIDGDTHLLPLKTRAWGDSEKLLRILDEATSTTEDDEKEENL